MDFTNATAQDLATAYRKVADELESSGHVEVDETTVDLYVALWGDLDQDEHWQLSYAALQGKLDPELVREATRLFNTTL
jgi:hypothetical protein